VQVGVRLDLLQRLAPVLARHVEVEQDEARSRGRAGRVVAAPLEEVVHQLLAVLDEAQVVGDAALLHRPPRQQAVVGVVVGHQNHNRVPLAH
jgi:hypothetical protein